MKLYLVPQSEPPRSPGPTDPGVVRAVTAAGGRFRFSAKDLTFTALDGLPARRPGLLIAAAEGYGPDWVQTWGQTGSSFVSHWDPVKGGRVDADAPPRRRADPGPAARPRWPPARRRGRQADRPRRAVEEGSERTPGEAEVAHNGCSSCRWITTEASSTPGVLPGVTTEAVTDADGRFRLQGLGRERLARLNIRGPGVADTSIVVMTREAADVHVRRLGRLEGSRDLRGQLHARAGTGPDRDGRGVATRRRARRCADVWVGPGIEAIAALRRATIRTPPTRKAGSPSRASRPTSWTSITRR